MKVGNWHDWKLNSSQAFEIQRQLSAQVSSSGEVTTPKFIAGADIAVGKANELSQAAVVVLSYPELKLVAVELVQGRLELPYIPGLLSFRESPLILTACQRLSVTPDLFIIDGQGIAHPRRLGIASHLGLLLDIPTIGCAKSRLCGSNIEPADDCGSYAEVMDKGEIIGVALRTKNGVKSVYVSIGHKISLQNAIFWVLKCCRGYRLPEPTRLAHLAAGGNLKQSAIAQEKGYQESF
jgi:deoxyribonuclease V